MKIRNKNTLQIFEVLPGTLYAKNIFEEVTDDDIKVGEPKVEFEIKEEPEPKPEPAKKPKAKRATNKKPAKKGGKKNASTKTK